MESDRAKTLWLELMGDEEDGDIDQCASLVLRAPRPRVQDSKQFSASRDAVSREFLRHGTADNLQKGLLKLEALAMVEFEDDEIVLHGYLPPN
jgi:hypothetical protein